MPRRSSPTRRALPVLILAAALSTAAADTPEQPLLGFSNARAAEQRAREARFDASLKADNLRQWMERLSAHPHPVGSPWGKENAELMAGLFRSWGYDTRIEEFQVLFPTPKVRLLEMTAPTPFTAALAETPVPG
ncbi:MAG TPA: folate hydrolase, partial [Thermoanaerobaculia bacterium]|nr:folate hydrolase [Thermoanaerobaculia bacterium]